MTMLTMSSPLPINTNTPAMTFILPTTPRPIHTNCTHICHCQPTTDDCRHYPSFCHKKKIFNPTVAKAAYSLPQPAIPDHWLCTTYALVVRALNNHFWQPDHSVYLPSPQQTMPPLPPTYPTTENHNSSNPSMPSFHSLGPQKPINSCPIPSP